MDQFVAVGSQYLITTFTIPPNLIRSKFGTRLHRHCLNWDRLRCFYRASAH